MEQKLQPMVVQWMEMNPERAAAMSEEEIDELFSLFGVGGPLTQEGVETFVQQLERKREVRRLVGELMSTHLADSVENVVNGLYALVQPYPGRR